MTTPPVRSAINALVWVSVGLLAILTASGLYLTVRYHPKSSGLPLTVQRVHAVAGRFAIVVAAVLAVLVVVAIVQRAVASRVGAVIGAVGNAIALIVCVVLGFVVAWDQVGVFATTPLGIHVEGVLLHDYEVLFVRNGTDEIAWHTFQRIVWAHIVVLPVLIAAALVLVVWSTRRSTSVDASTPVD